jgi:hypothetical protein
MTSVSCSGRHLAPDVTPGSVLSSWRPATFRRSGTVTIDAPVTGPGTP